MHTPITLSLLERTILSNQNRILALLDPEESKRYNNLAEILELGYTGLYPKIFEHTFDGISNEICQETFEILTMFRSIEHAICSLSDDQKTEITYENLTFQGFDANNDPHYSFAEFLIKKEGKYQEFNDNRSLNSHSSGSLPTYRQMLNIFREIVKSNNGKHFMSYSDLKKIRQA
jgi:uncharacterized protein YfbU (UPF0304 family)